MHAFWGYCWKWSALGGGVAIFALVGALALGAIAARAPRRALAGVVLGVLVASVALVGARVGMLVLWNGVRPAICDRAI